MLTNAILMTLSRIKGTYTIPGPGTFSNLSSFEDFEDAAVVAGAALVTSRCTSCGLGGSILLFLI